MITYNCKSIEEYQSLREQLPPDWFQAVSSPAIAPRSIAPIATAKKGECEKLYNSTFKNSKGLPLAFRFTQAQFAKVQGMRPEEVAKERELLCAACLASGERNGGNVESMEKGKGEDAGATYDGEEVEPDEGMF